MSQLAPVQALTSNLPSSSEPDLPLSWRKTSDQQPQIAMMLLVCSTHSPEELQSQLQCLDAMGFHDKNVILQALVLTNGDLNKAVEFLLDGSIILPRPGSNAPIEIQLGRDGFRVQPLQPTQGQNHQIQPQHNLSMSVEQRSPDRQLSTVNFQMKQEDVNSTQEDEQIKKEKLRIKKEDEMS